MKGLTEEELKHLHETVNNLNSTSESLTYRLIEIKGSYYIHPQFPSED